MSEVQVTGRQGSPIPKSDDVYAPRMLGLDNGSGTNLKRFAIAASEVDQNANSCRMRAIELFRSAREQLDRAQADRVPPTYVPRGRPR
jgi:hypothetical protein